MTESTLRDAATVIILREGEDGPEVFMVRRHHNMAFMGDRYVYPGGKLDDEDLDPDLRDRIVAWSAEDAHARIDEEDPDRALGLFVAGVRETFEEAGLLYARPAGGEDFVDLDAHDERFREHRRALNAGESSLFDILEAEDLTLPLAEIGYFAHWITPFVEQHRYDTHFFLVPAPAHQTALHDAHETVDSTWLRPEEALERYENEAIRLAPPTFHTLRRLARFASVDEAMDYAHAHRPPTILPHMEARGHDIHLLMPGDPDYPTDDPRYAIADPEEEDLLHLIMIDKGLWKIVET